MKSSALIISFVDDNNFNMMYKELGLVLHDSD